MDPITNEEEAFKYLESTQFAASSLKLLSGGNTNFIFRISLKNPYQGYTTVVMKHAEPFAAISRDFSLDLNRMITEHDVLEWASQSGMGSTESSGIVVRIPTIYFFDKERHVLIMEDMGLVPTLKSFVSDGRLQEEDVSAVGKALSAFLSKFHEKGRTDEKLKDIATNNTFGKNISIWREYGRMKENTVLDDETKKKLGPVIEFVSKSMKDENNQVIMGDMWPGNIMVKADEQNRVKILSVVDFEMTRHDLYGIELGQLGAECFLLHFFKGQDIGLLRSVLKSYPGFENDVELKRLAAIHLGAHLATWTPVVPWGSKEKTDECTKLGAELMIRSFHRDTSYVDTFLGL